MRLPKIFVAALLASAAIASPSFAALKTGDAAPDFALKGAVGGKDFNFSLKDALKKGPVVVYFYPSAFTAGCNAEAHTFAEEKEKFDAAGATIVGVSGDSIERLHAFSADPQYCANKFPVVSDPDHKVAKAFDLMIREAKAGQKDTRGVEIGHDFDERTTFIVTSDRKIVATLSSADDNVSPVEHVEKSLAVVEQLKAAKKKG